LADQDDRFVRFKDGSHMKSAFRRFARASVVAVALAAGCKTPPDSSSKTRSISPTPVAQARQVATTAPSSEANATDSGASPLPDALAKKTAAYAHSFDAAPSTAHQSAAAPSPVQWDEPKKPGITVNPAPTAAAPSAENAAAVLPPAPSQSKTAPTASPAPGTPQLATAVARAAKANALNDVPAIVPESSDFGTPSNGTSAADALEDRLSKRVRENPRDLAAEFDYELYQLLNDESSPQLASISQLPNEDKELVAAVVDGVSNFRTGVRQDANMLLSKKIRPLLDMSDRLKSQAELSVPTVALCKRVDGFGKYEPVDPVRFPAGRENATIVYCEIENFESHMNEKRLWQTQLTQQVTLFTETGMLVWSDKTRPVTDECRNRRHDFFLYDLVKLPGNLTIGRYLLKVSIEDRLAHRVAEATVPVEIVGQ
jgi:hypothetical protein